MSFEVAQTPNSLYFDIPNFDSTIPIPAWQLEAAVRRGHLAAYDLQRAHQQVHSAL